MKTKKNENQSSGKSFLGIITMTAMLAVLLLAACQTQLQNNTSSNANTGAQGGNLNLQSNAPATQGLKVFNNADELKNFLAMNSISANGNLDSGRGALTMGAAPEIMMKTSAVSDLTTSSGSAGASDFSTTNIQVEGVDEADFMKNDAQYIYMIADNKLIVVDAYNAETASIISTTQINSEDENDGDYYNQPIGKDIIINGDKLVLFVQGNEKAFYFQEYDITPMPAYKSATYVKIYDISDKTNPQLLKSYTLPGSYYQSRMIGNYVYAISQEGVYNNVYVDEPVVMQTDARGVSSQAIMPKIYYFDNPEQNYQFNTITSIDLSDNSVQDSKTFMLGYSNTLMVSQNNIFIAYQKQQYWPMPFMRIWGGSSYDAERFTNAILPLLPDDAASDNLKSDIQSIMKKGLKEEDQWKQVSGRLAQFYTKLDNDETLKNQYESTFQRISDAVEEYDNKKALENSKTIIQKIAIDKGSIEYKAKGEVYGTLLNQFSLDEYNGDLRVATTVNIWSGKSATYNNVYVLDDSMTQVGKLENLAEGERIYSTRFIGDKLYMVTFKQVDPLFAIDLSEPANPKVLGYLKIPGFSDYLHPYDATHIIGVGKETAENDFGGITTKGLKIALFDASDFSNPKLVDSVVIGDQGTDSPALHDHHAFLFSLSKNLLVLPVTEVINREKVNQYLYSNTIWHGAYVFHVDETGFSQIGKVQHSSTKSDYFDWWNQASVLRSLYMDNNLYTISNKYIKINDLENDLKELNTIVLPYEENRPYYYWGRTY